MTQERIEHTILAWFSLDETFDIGEETGTPVVLDYENIMPFAFTGTINKLDVLLQPEKLSEEDRKKILEMEAKADMGAQ